VISSLDWGTPYPAPAKLNTFLHVTGRREDGYHTLQTAFRLIDLCDTLTFYPRTDDKIVLKTKIPNTCPTQELSVRAATLLQKKAGMDCGVDIHIEKRIPMGAGLGGGSSDAATTLIALNHLWKIHWDRITLQRLAVALGADVPFFIFGQDAFADGIGEQLQPIDVPNATYVILFPPVHVPTGQIFSCPDLKRDCQPIRVDEALSIDNQNVLTPVAVRYFPVIQEYLDWLAQFGHAKMSGSGAAVFLECADINVAQRIYNRRPSSYHGVVVSALPRHPLYSMIANPT